MAEPIDVALFCEDRAHEQFVRALVARIAREISVPVEINPVTVRGGFGRVITELSAWQRAVSQGLSRPDLLIVVRDANCKGWNEARTELQRAIDTSLFPHSVVGCPAPHVERWCLADPSSFARVVEGPAPAPPADKCERGFYKTLLREAILAADQLIVTDEMEYAPELVDAMDLYRAGKNQASLRHFHDDLQAALGALARR